MPTLRLKNTVKAVSAYLLLFRIFPDRYGADEAAYTRRLSVS